ncbi:hypothetical protein, partial [Parasutterella excrementihominis]
PNAMPGGQRLISRWEAVIVFVPEGRRSRTSGPRVSDVLTTAIPQLGFTGAKPAEWTRWVLEALGYDAASDTVADLFVGSGAVTSALDNLVPGH